jgi:hypothetical protein
MKAHVAKHKDAVKHDHVTDAINDDIDCSSSAVAKDEEFAGRRLPSGDQPGGFVVYNQTVELVSMLNRRGASILDDDDDDDK